MDLRDKAIGASAVVEFCIRQIERELAAARAEAQPLDEPDLMAAIDFAQVRVRKAHRALEALREQMSSTLGAPISTRSGPEDKPDDGPPVSPAP